MKKYILLFWTLILTIPLFAQLEVKPDSFKEVPGFVNINPDDNYQADDNNLPFAVIKIRTENIIDKHRRELKFSGNAGTFIMLEYKDGEVWVYLTAQYADYLKISHPDFSSIEFTLPFDLKPKCGYEMTLVNNSYLTEMRESDIMSDKYNFSVSSNDKVLFSKGNLQYNPVTKIWRFAEHQWDYIGEDNKNISQNYNGWIDLFGWGTGDNPTKTSKNSAYYTSFIEWGTNTISNDVNNDWYTMTKDEWIYVFEKRNTTSGLRYVKAIVNGVRGVILLPDQWKSSFYNFNNPNESNKDYSCNRISLNDWMNRVEINGAVFLPASGYRSEQTIVCVGTHGYYWSATWYDGLYRYIVFFGDKGLTADIWFPVEGAYSVRLVRNAE